MVVVVAVVVAVESPPEKRRFGPVYVHAHAHADGQGTQSGTPEESKSIGGGESFNQASPLLFVSVSFCLFSFLALFLDFPLFLSRRAFFGGDGGRSLYVCILVFVVFLFLLSPFKIAAA